MEAVMRQSTVLLIAILFVLAAGTVPVGASATPSTEMATAQFLVGKWSCLHTTDSEQAGMYTTTYASVLGDRWLKQTFDFPATTTDPALQGEWILGYDVKRQRWVRFGAMSDGLYFAMFGSRSGDTWSWSYVLPGQSEEVATTYTKTSDSQYKVDGPSYPVNGRMITEHHLCNKVS
jgi:hypothetical protein